MKKLERMKKKAAIASEEQALKLKKRLSSGNMNPLALAVHRRVTVHNTSQPVPINNNTNSSRVS